MTLFFNLNFENKHNNRVITWDGSGGRAFGRQLSARDALFCDDKKGQAGGVARKTSRRQRRERRRKGKPLLCRAYQNAQCALLTQKSPVLPLAQGKLFRQHRTKNGWRLCLQSAC